MRWWSANVKDHPERLAELNQLGFVWERLQPEWNLIFEALMTYKALNGDLLVPTSFAVPFGDTNWPKATWGISLGKCVTRMRLRNDFLKGSKGATRRSHLDGLGFVWDVSEHHFRRFGLALQCFKNLEISKIEEERLCPIRVPSRYVVPASKEWPKELWGYPLGTRCTQVRQKGLYVKGDQGRQRLLEDLGFQWNGNSSLGWLEVVHAAALYSQMNGRTLNVPIKFVVPHPPKDSSNDAAGSNSAWPWPDYLWGFPLGQRLKDVRLKGAYLRGNSASKRRAQLTALGFNWKPRRGRPPKRSTAVKETAQSIP